MSHKIDEVLRLPEVKQATGLGRSSIYRKISCGDAGYDSSFPRPFKLGRRAIGWLSSDVLGWVAARKEN